MEENLLKSKSSDTNNATYTFLNIVKRFWVLIVIAVLAGIGVGAFYAKTRVKPVYTVKSNVMLVVNLQTTTLQNEISLSKMYVPKIAQVATTEYIAKQANNEYRNGDYQNKSGSISFGSIGESHNDDSLIFSISYADYNQAVVKDKFDAVLKAFAKELKNNPKDYINADGIDLVATQMEPTMVVSVDYARPIIFGAIIGVAVGAVLALLIYLLDNKIKDQRELERITGVNLLAYIDKQED